MVKPEWGIKRLCQSCGARYYDFLRTPIVCPSCGTTFDSEAVLKSRRARPLPVDDPKPKARKEADVDAEEADDVDDEEDVEDEDELDEEAEIDEAPIDEDDEEEAAEPAKRLPDVDVDDEDDDDVDIEDDDDDLAPIDDDEEVEPDEGDR